MDAFTKLADAASSTFPTVTGYSMYDFVLYGKALVTEFIAGPIILVMYNERWFIAWGVIILIVAFGFRFFVFFRGPYGRGL